MNFGGEEKILIAFSAKNETPFFSFLGSIIVLGYSSLIFAGPIENYIENPPEIENPPWEGSAPPEISIPLYQARLRDSSSDRDRGFAVANLAFIARQMADIPEYQEVAKQLADQYIMPNLDFTKPIEETNFASWRRTVLSCKNIYERIGDHEAERKCLELFYRANKKPDDRELALHLLAYQQVRLGNYKKAIKTIKHIPEESKWSNNREKLIKAWTNEMLETSEPNNSIQ
ncbi:hypothetical protein [Luteolibacter sp. AS25]|uniref:hypothetical protein n=1 Tax=Luteolibacter sp. AS25 TaxID=3135776 RepID=UPI00398B1653